MITRRHVWISVAIAIFAILVVAAFLSKSFLGEDSVEFAQLEPASLPHAIESAPGEVAESVPSSIKKSNPGRAYRRQGRAQAGKYVDSPASAIERDPIEVALETQAWPARAAIEANQHMSFGDRQRARLHVQRGEATEIDTLVSGRMVFDSLVEITPEVEATAEATHHLKVVPTDPDRQWQTIRTNAPTSWTWDIEAVEEGTGSVTFSLRQKIVLNDEERVVIVREFPHTVEITIGLAARTWRSVSSAIDYVAAGWAFFTGAGGAIAAFLAWLGRHRLFRRWLVPANGRH